MKMTRLVMAVALALAAAGQAAFAATIKVGSPAPKLTVAKWVQGDPVKEFEKDKVYMVEFWATWCGPCVASIPHVNELYTKFKDKGFVVIGANVWEEDESEIPKFMKRMGNKMTYRVALDDKSKSKKGAMAEGWMEAAGQRGIPAAFLVDKQGKIAWIGHPMSLKEKTIEQLLEGTYDVKKAAVEAEAAEKREAEMMGIQKKLVEAMQGSKWDDAEAAVTEMEKIEDDEIRARAGFVRVQINLEKKDPAAAAKAAVAVGDKYKENEQLQNAVAWALATYEKPTDDMIKAADQLAGRANTLTKGENAQILDTVARVQFLKGEKNEAIATQEKAVARAEEGRLKEHLNRTLALYKKGELPED